MIVLTNGEGKVGFETAVAALNTDKSALDAVELGIREVEKEPSIQSVGRGGHPNLLGDVECDAAIMDGATCQVGAVGGQRGYIHAITTARRVMEQLPHVFITGQGTALFSRECGAEPSEMLTEQSAREHELWLDKNIPTALRPNWPTSCADSPLTEHVWRSGDDLTAGGTTIYLAIDNQGSLAGGASTSGWARKYPGRMGDSAIIGAGLYVDNRYGACGCTHTGEMTIRAGTARSVVLYIKKGATVEEACAEALSDLSALRSGYLGPVAVHAIDRHGNPCVMGTHDLDPGIFYCFWDDKSGQLCYPKPVLGQKPSDSVS